MHDVADVCFCRLLKHWCAIHKITNFEQVRNEFWERFDVNKERRISKVNLLGGSADKDSMEKDKPEEHKNEEFKKPRGSLPGVLSLRKKSSELIEKEKGEKGDKEKSGERSLFGVLVDRSADNAAPCTANVSNSTISTTPHLASAPRGSLFGLRNSGGVEAMGSNSHEPRGSLFGNLGGNNNTDNNNTNDAKLNNNAHATSPIPRSSLFGLRTSHAEQIVIPTEHRGSLFDLNKSRSGALEHNPANSPSFFRAPSPILTSLNHANANILTSSSPSIPELNLRGPRASLPNTAAPRRVPKTRKSLPNPTLAKVFSFLHDSTTAHTTAASSPVNPTTPTTNAPTPSARLDSTAKPSPVTPHTRGTSPFRVFDLLTTRQVPHTPTNHQYPALLITGPTKPLPLAAQVPETAMRNEEKEDCGVNPSSSFPSYLNPSDCIDKELLRGVLAVSIPEFVLELELGRLHAQNVFTLLDAHALSLQELEGIVRPGIARGLYEFLHERRSSLSSPTLTPYRNSPNHSRSSKFREKLQGRTSVSWGSLSRSDKDNGNPLDLLEPPARFRPSKRFVFNGPTLTGDDLVLNYPSIPPLRSETSEKRFSI